jgi:hypothetical protein
LTRIGDLYTIDGFSRNAYGDAIGVSSRADIGSCYSLSGNVPTLTFVQPGFTYTAPAAVMCNIPTTWNFWRQTSRWARVHTLVSYSAGWYIGAFSQINPGIFFLLPISSPAAAVGSLVGHSPMGGTYTCTGRITDNLCF